MELSQVSIDDRLTCTEKTSYLKEDISPEALQTMKDTMSQSAKMSQPRAVQENDGVPRVAPKWLKHDR